MGSSYRTVCGTSATVYPPVIIQLDLESSHVSLQEKVRTILGVYGHVDILVNNAGISSRGEAVETSPEVDVRVMAVNYFGTVALTKGILPNLVMGDIHLNI